MGGPSRRKPGAASKPGPEQQQQAKHGAQPPAGRQSRQRAQKAAAAQHIADESDVESLLGEFEEEADLDWDPAAGDCLDDKDDDLADDFLADLADEVLRHSEDDSDQEAAARKHHRADTAR